ncbi:MAG: AbrB family transcriptional regulator [Pseudomonadota bacterium]
MTLGPTLTALARREVTWTGQRYALGPMLTTILIGAGGGALAHPLGLPLPWMSGALIAVAAAALAGVRTAGLRMTFPLNLRYLFVPIVGVAIGGQFTPELLDAAAGWWLTLLVMFLYLPVAHLIGFVIYRHAGYGRVTALYAAMPGGLIEAVALGERAGGDGAALTLLQFSRLILCILCVPFAITLYEGVAVGSASGVSIGSATSSLGLWDVIVLTAAGAVGLLGGRWLGLPAAIITGPILVSAAVHIAGLTAAHPPDFLIALTQLVVGTALGVRFVETERRAALRGLGWAAVTVALVLSLALAVAAPLSLMTEETAEAILLAFAPGGVTEMSLVALSLQISVLFVTAHHVARILFIVFMVTPTHAWLRRHRGWE